MPLTNIALSYSNYAGSAKHPVGIEWCGGGGWHGKHVERTLLPFQSKVSLSSTLSWTWLTLIWKSRTWLIYHLNLFTWTLVVDGFQPDHNFGLIPSERSTFPSGLGGGALKMSWLAGSPKWRELKLKWKAGYKREKGAYIYIWLGFPGPPQVVMRSLIISEVVISKWKEFHSNVQYFHFYQIFHIWRSWTLSIKTGTNLVFGELDAGYKSKLWLYLEYLQDWLSFWPWWSSGWDVEGWSLGRLQWRSHGYLCWNLCWKSQRF